MLAPAKVGEQARMLLPTKPNQPSFHKTKLETCYVSVKESQLTTRLRDGSVITGAQSGFESLMLEALQRAVYALPCLLACLCSILSALSVLPCLFVLFCSVLSVLFAAPFLDELVDILPCR